MNKLLRPSPRYRSAGFSLIEVLVAIVVLSVGLLGLAALQLKGLQSAHSAYQRSLASVIANDGAERLWVELGADPNAAPATIAANAEIAWHQNWTRPDAPSLPGFVANSTITFNSGFYVINVQWGEERFAGNDGVSNFEYRIALPN